MTKRTLVALVLCAATAVVALAHPGGLDANGGHHDRQNGGYHYHRGPNAAKPATTTPPPVLRSADLSATRSSGQAAAVSREEFDALVSLLERKGVLTRAELVREMSR